MDVDKIFAEDLQKLVNYKYMKNLYGKTIMITGITGLVGSQFAKAVLMCNKLKQADIKIIGCARNEKKTKNIFGDELENSNFRMIYQEITDKLNIKEPIDYIIHSASITNSKMFVTKPVETIEIAVQGTANVLEFAKKKAVKNLIYLSSMEVYGVTDENIKNVTEKDMGFIEILNTRSSYSEGKRICECLCYAYKEEYGVNVTIARLAQTFGAGIPLGDTRIFAQLAKSVIDKTDIVLHTKGMSYGNYCYTCDAIKALILLLTKGVPGEAYNVVNEENNFRIKEMAEMVACDIAHNVIKVTYDIPDTDNIYGYAPDVKMKLSSEKLRALGWEPEFGLKKSYERLIDSIKLRQMC